MTTETLSTRPKPGFLDSLRTNPTVQRIRSNWLYRFIAFPLGQMFVFIVGAALVMTVIAYVVALLIPEPRPNIILADQISKQLPGMIISGIGIGFVYAMIALGYTLVYGVLKFINFAHSEIFMFGGVIGYEFLIGLQEGTLFTTWSSFILIAGVVILAVILSRGVGGVVERVTSRPVAGATQLLSGVIAVVISFLIIEVVRLVLVGFAAPTLLTTWSPFLLVPVMVILSMLFSGGLAVVIERVAYRPLRGAPRLVPLITAIGISFLLVDGVRAFIALTRNDFNLTYPTQEFSALNTPIPLVFNGPVVGGFTIGGVTYEQIVADGATLDQWDVDGVTYGVLTVGGVNIGGTAVKTNDIATGETEYELVTVDGRDLDEIEDIANIVNVRVTVVIIVFGAVIALLLLNFFVNGTKIGRGIRAVSQDQATAGLMGINVNRMIAITFFLGGAFGGAAGALFGLNVGTVTPYVGFIPGLKAFTAAVLGGIGNVTGALLGGLTLGMVESFLNGTLVYFPALGQRYTDIFAFSVLILILIFRPSGLLGERVDEKV